MRVWLRRVCLCWRSRQTGNELLPGPSSLLARGPLWPALLGLARGRSTSAAAWGARLLASPCEIERTNPINRFIISPDAISSSQSHSWPTSNGLEQCRSSQPRASVRASQGPRSGSFGQSIDRSLQQPANKLARRELETKMMAKISGANQIIDIETRRQQKRRQQPHVDSLSSLHGARERASEMGQRGSLTSRQLCDLVKIVLN